MRGALAEVSKGQLNEVEQMKRCLAVLHEDGTSGTEREGEEDDEEQDQDEREAALEVLSELCENLDNARGGSTQRDDPVTDLSVEKRASDGLGE